MKFNGLLTNKLLTFSVIIFTLFFFSESYFDHIESGIYYSYTKSIVEDGDLNVVNQILKLDDMESSSYKLSKGGEGNLVTPNDNSPAFWSHGGVIFWSPFYIFSKIINKVFKVPQDKYYVLQHLGLVLTTILSGFLCILLTLKLQETFFKKNYLFPVVIGVFTTPFFYYWIFEPGNGNILTTFMSPILILSYWKLYCDRDNSFSSWMFLGIFTMMGLIIKIDIIFHGVIFSHLSIMILFRKRPINFLKNYIPLGLGFSIPLLLQIYNNYTQYNIFTYSYTGIMNEHYSVLKDALFSAYRGHIYTSPVFLLIPFIIFYLFYKLRNKISEKLVFFLILFTVPVIKEIIATSSYNHGSGNFGARVFCTEFAIIVLGLSYFYHMNNKARLLIKIFSLASLIWSFAMLYFYIGDDKGAFQSLFYSISTMKYWGIFWSNLNYIPSFFYYLITHFNNVLIKFISFSPIIIGFAFIYKKLWEELSSKNILSFTKNLTMYMVGAYTFITVLNTYWNPINAKEMRASGFLNNTITGNGNYIYMYEENIISIEERMMLEKAKENNKQFKKLLVIREEYHKNASKELVTKKKNIDLRFYFPFPELGYDDQFLREFKLYKIPKLNSIVR